MRYKTDLDAVKHVAVSLLHTHINETKFSPMVVQHPFTSSGFVGISNNGEMELLNILESSESKVKEIAELSRQSLVISELMKKGILESSDFYSQYNELSARISELRIKRRER